MNQPALTITSPYPRDIKQAWDGYHQKNPKARLRKTAKALNVSEAELVATGCGVNVTRLEPIWFHLFQSLGELGPVMALTRNDCAVHEKVGLYSITRFVGDRCLVLGDNIDLKLGLNHWHSGFAVEDVNRTGPGRYSLQFFDSDGTSVHKIYMTECSSLRAYHSLVNAFKRPDQSLDQLVRVCSQQSEHLDDDIDTDCFREHWRKLKTPLDLPALLNKFGIDQFYSLQLVENKFVSRVPHDLFHGIMQTVSEIQLPIRILVESRGVTQSHGGSIQNLRSTGPWLNVLDDAFSLHINQKAIASLWVVNWPFAVGTVTSLELYDELGYSIAKLFGESNPGVGENPMWLDLMASLPVAKEVA